MPRDTTDVELQSGYFGVEVDKEEIAFFTACSGINLEFTVIEHKHATQKGQQITTKIPGEAKYSEIVLKRGFTPNKKLYDWFDSVLKGGSPTMRRTGSVILYTRDGEEAVRFNFDNMWPSKITASDLSVGSEEVMIEELTMQHELLEWK
jgi:phage tail-like protein